MHREPWSFAVIQDRSLLLRVSERAKAILRESDDEHARALVEQPGFRRASSRSPIAGWRRRT
jgi:hypothetical protein